MLKLLEALVPCLHEATHCHHCHLICCVYIEEHVEMVDTKDQSNAIVY